MQLVLATYLVLNLLIGLRLYVSLRKRFGLHLLAFWLPFGLLASSFPLAFSLTGTLANLTSCLSGFHLAMLYFLALFYPLAFLVSWTARRFAARYDLYLIATVLALFVALPIGIFLGRSPVVKPYDVTFTKPMPTLRIALIADFHLGPQAAPLADTVAAINATQPDVILLAGDLLDSGTTPQYDLTPFRALKSTYGTYAVLGNHDHGLTREMLSAVNVTLLQDETVLIADAFYLVGRQDKTTRGALPLTALLDGISGPHPIIVLDHSPSRAGEAVLAHADLQLSGHTHNGQLFPINFLVGQLFPTNYGWIQKQHTQLIVSSGVGTWGTPIRTSGRAEIVLITARGDTQ